jgi:FkbM family methyltransferase
LTPRITMTNSYIRNIFKGIQLAASRLLHSPYRKVNINWFKLKALKHLPTGKEREHILFNKKVFYLNPQDFLHGIKEIFVEEIYKQQLPANAFVIDCGSNIGLSIIYMKQICPTATIIGFEPDQKNYDLLIRNLQSFQLTNITIHKAAVWIQNGPLQFTDTGTMGSSISTAETEKTITVEGMRLRDLLTKKVDFLKIDIEGAEYAVLKDIEPALNLVQNLFVEYHGNYSQNNELTEIFSILVKNGFNYYIKEATSIYDYPLTREKKNATPFDVQLNIFCTRSEQL